MKLWIDNNHLLSIENPNILPTKEFVHVVEGYVFSDFDKGLIVLHKKNWKIINLKNLGEGMSVAYIKMLNVERRTTNVELDLDFVKQAFGLFDGFDEETGEKYFFVPGVGDKDIGEKNKILKKLELGCFLNKVEGYARVDLLDPPKSPLGGGAYLSFLFGLLLLYGKWEAKNKALRSFKIQVPLFGQYLKYVEVFDVMLKKMQEDGFFLTSSQLKTNNGIVYQISCRDYEILELLAKWHERVEKFDAITKVDFTHEMKNNLIEFVKSDSQIPSEGKIETLKLIEGGILKLLTK